jgi:hypothetical protein
MLSRGRFLCVDDLVTDASERSRGYGDFLFWSPLCKQQYKASHKSCPEGYARRGQHENSPTIYCWDKINPTFQIKSRKGRLKNCN